MMQPHPQLSLEATPLPFSLDESPPLDENSPPDENRPPSETSRSETPHPSKDPPRGEKYSPAETPPSGEKLRISYNRSRAHRIWIKELVARLLLNMLITASIAGCLAGFSKINDLHVWPKRIFNTLAIALTSLLSVGIGSIIGELGKTIRWKILASAPHNLQDVSSSFGIMYIS